MGHNKHLGDRMDADFFQMKNYMDGQRDVFLWKSYYRRRNGVFMV